MFPRFEIVRRLRPFDLVAPRDVRLSVAAAGTHAMAAVAPYVAAEAAVDGPCCEVAFHLAGRRLAAVWSGGSVSLSVGDRSLRSRRFARTETPDRLGLTLTGMHLTAWSRESGSWVARARHDLGDDFDPRHESTLAGLEVETPSTPTVAGGFGQLGLRDIRLVSEADGTPLREGGDLWLTATSAGPGFFDTAHTSVWRFSTSTYELTHTADLFFRRPDRPGVFGDHATHLVRDGNGWLVATSTWGDFQEPTSRAGRRAPSGLRIILAEVKDTSLLVGTHVLDTRELPMPTDGFTSIATWDPHLVRRDGQWLVGFVSARRFFDFHPALAGGGSLSDLCLIGAGVDRRSTEGTTLVQVDGQLVVVASDGRDGRRGQRARFPIFDTHLTEIGVLDAAYPTNLPWPTLAPVDGGWLMVTFNGRQRGGRLLGYGTHGDLVVMRSG